MFKNILSFEIRYRLGRPATYIYFCILLLVPVIFTMAQAVQVGSGSNVNVFRNSPVTIAELMNFMSLMGMAVISAIMSTPVYRDFEHDTHHLYFTLPVSKFSYLGGRFAGSLVICLMVFTAIPLGIIIGSILGPLTGTIDADRIGPVSLMYYVQPFLTIILPNVLFSGAIFFSLATLTRQIVYSYLGNIVLLVAYITTQSLLGDINNKFIASLFDPSAGIAITEITRYWTTPEWNTQLIPFTGVFVLNRVLWTAVASVLFIFTYRRFRFSSILENSRRKGIQLVPADSEGDQPVLVPVQQHFSFGNSLKQLLNLGVLNFKSVVKELPFLAITLCGVILLVCISMLLQSLYGTSIYPVTYALLEKTSGIFSLFVLAIIILYSGELVWQERKLKMNLIYDALPVPNWLLLGSKMLAMFLIITFLMGVIMVSNIMIQLSQSFTNIDIALYIKDLFYLKLFGFMLIAILALLVQTLVTDKFLGHFIMVLYFVVNIVMGPLGLDHNLYKYNGRPSYVYSEMNGYGHMLTGVNWLNLYWGLFALLLAIASNLFWMRGIEGSFKWKARMAWQRFTRPAKLTVAICLIAFIGTGSWIFYNTNVLNIYRTNNEREQLAVRYEKTYKRYENIPQPKITAAKLFVDIFPGERAVRSRGTLTLKNATGKSIDSVHLDVPAETEIKLLTLNGSHNTVLHDKEFGYMIYKLSKPLLPGDSIPLDFDFYYKAKGFTNSIGNTSLVYNGTFLNNTTLCPSIGYNADGELDDKAKRRKNGLKPRERMASVNDSAARMNTYIGNHGDWINFEATVSTSSDQVAIAPGYLQKQWNEGDRRYYHYKMDCKILNFYSFLSARYEVKKDKWKDVNLEIYYQKGHEYNLDKMMKSMKKSLDYYTANFSPYQHRQVRIVEFPRYATFAQSFPNTIPFSENIGFIANLKNADDIDYVFYVTAHEVGHQWWAHQVIGGNVQGATLMSETMSQYSSLMVMEKEYGKDKMRRFLKYELDQYLQLRKFENQKELPAMLCENQQYIHYNKGSLIMYALKDYIGEEKLNSALAAYIKKVGFQNAPFTNSIEFLGFIRQATPDSLQYLVNDMFETITLYSNKAEEVSYTKMKDGQYKVKIVVDSHKFRADSLGKENEIAMNDYIDIGVIGEEKKGNTVTDKTLHLHKYKVRKGRNTFEIIVKEEPKKAGIDIYNKLIDRDSDDNIKPASLAA